METIELKIEEIAIPMEQNDAFMEESDAASTLTILFDKESDNESGGSTILFEKTNEENSNYLSSYVSFLDQSHAESVEFLEEPVKSFRKKRKDPLVQKYPKKLKLFLQQEWRHADKPLCHPIVISDSMNPSVVLRRIKFNGLNRDRFDKKFNFILKSKGKRHVIISMDKAQLESTDSQIPKAERKIRNRKRSVNFDPMIKSIPNTKSYVEQVTHMKNCSVNIERLPIQISSITRSNGTGNSTGYHVDEIQCGVDLTAVDYDVPSESQQYGDIIQASKLSNESHLESTCSLTSDEFTQKHLQLQKCSLKVKPLHIRKASISRSKEMKEPTEKRIQSKIKFVNIAVQTKSRQCDAIIQTDQPVEKKFRNFSCQTLISEKEILAKESAEKKAIADLKNEMNVKQEQHEKDMLALRNLLCLEQSRVNSLIDLLKQQRMENVRSSQVVNHTLIQPQQPAASEILKLE